MYWLGLSMCYGIGPAKFQTLLSFFETAENAWKATQSELQESVGNAATALIMQHRNEFSPEAYLEKMHKKAVDFLTIEDEEYPELLSQIQKPPSVLFIKGNKQLLKHIQNKNAIAVVGTRKITDYGRLVTQTLTQELASFGYVIVSGLALGVDAVAHRAALDVKGKTVAVLGCGVDCCSPLENSNLYADILKNDGMIVSEYGLGIVPSRGSFPARNRIIAGLSVGVLVTEGAEDSGSLITANDAIKNGRRVFSVPGPITSSVSRGPIALIAKGAKMVTSAEDILKELNAKGTTGTMSTTSIKGDTEEEQCIIDLLSDENLHFDELVKKTGLDSSHVGTLLSLMEMKGIIQPYAAGIFGLA